MNILSPFDTPQNPPLDSKDFIKYCEKLGIEVTVQELQLYKKAGLIKPVASTTRGTLYSSFQFYAVDRAKSYASFEIDRAKTRTKTTGVKVFARGGKVYLKADLHLEIEIAESESLPTSGGGEHRTLDHAKALQQRFRDIVSGKELKERLTTDPLDFNRFLEFLLAVEDVYIPYFRSGGDTVQVRGSDLSTWQRKKDALDLNKLLSDESFDAQQLAAWYKRFSGIAEDVLSKDSDWLQLWENIEWGKKEKLIGEVRRGVEYLQWALMLKRMLEEYLGREVLGVDEVSNIGAEDILKLDPPKLDQRHLLMRAYRNNAYSDGDKNYYNIHFKRLQYLANDFGLNYQPKVFVFVEGQTEEHILPIIFMDMFGKQPESVGIEFRNLKGVTQLFSPTLNPKDDDGKYVKVVVSNFKHMLSYNLEKWQTIPFLVCDDENKILTQLTTHDCLSFGGGDYKLPEGWYALWGREAGSIVPSKDFELANYTNKELIQAATELDGTIKIPEQDVEQLRQNNLGLKQLPQPYGVAVDGLKISLADRLYSNLKAEYARTKDEALLERPVFKVLQRINRTAVLSYAPSDTKQEQANKAVILEVLQGKRPAW
jgi:hypothetical protein